MPKQYGKLGNPAQRAENAAKAFAMSLKGMTNGAIGAELGVSREAIRLLLKEYKDSLVTPLAEQARNVELVKLDGIEAIAWKLLEDNHVTVQHGKAVMLRDPETGAERTIKDTDPVFKAIASILKISERRAKYLGLDIPVKTEHVVTTQASFIDDNVARLVEEMSRNNDAAIAELGE